MPWLKKEEGFEVIDSLGKSKTPFLFIISYEQDKIFAQDLNTLDDEIYYTLKNHRNYPSQYKEKNFSFSKSPIAFPLYKKAFDSILEEIRQGNTYLLNLTFKTPISTNATLKEIFTHAQAPYKLYYKDEFICFSPECFVEIEENTLATYPMKGTIDANIHEAEQTLLNNAKELAEHIMVVDLMRNDLAIIGSHIQVEKFRTIEKIQAGEKELLQMSSKITANLPKEWKDSIGTLLSKILPAGSITGTPKKSTTKIINTIESDKRGFYTGIFGIFDGSSLCSAVMIRFIEKEKKQLYYKSGGGITLDSNAQSEYEELVDKVYLPLSKKEYNHK